MESIVLEEAASQTTKPPEDVLQAWTNDSQISELVQMDILTINFHITCKNYLVSSIIILFNM